MVIDSDIIIIGHLAKDIIEIDGKSYISLGGAVFYGAIAGSHMGLKVTVITRLKKDDYSLLTVFKKYGITYYVYPSEETSGLRNIYSSANMEFRNYKSLGFAGLFTKKEIPDSLKTKIFVIGPIMAGEIDLDLLKYLKKKYPKIISLDMQGFIRFRDKEKVFYSQLSIKEKKEIISDINVLKVDQTEAEILTNQKIIGKAANDLLTLGPKEILITHEKGISVFISNTSFHFPLLNHTSHQP